MIELLKILFVAIGTGVVANIVFFPLAFFLMKRARKDSASILSKGRMFFAYLASSLAFGILWIVYVNASAVLYKTTSAAEVSLPANVLMGTVVPLGVAALVIHLFHRYFGHRTEREKGPGTD